MCLPLPCLLGGSATRDATANQGEFVPFDSMPTWVCRPFEVGDIVVTTGYLVNFSHREADVVHPVFGEVTKVAGNHPKQKCTIKLRDWDGDENFEPPYELLENGLVRFGPHRGYPVLHPKTIQRTAVVTFDGLRLGQDPDKSFRYCPEGKVVERVADIDFLSE